MASIYDTVSGWSSTVNYMKYNIVSGSDSRFYYSVINNNIGAANNPTSLPNLQLEWDGYININSVLVPNFFWKPSYTSSISTTPDINIIQYGNGYQQRLNQTINPNLANFEAQFDNRLESEAVSLLHFLNARSAKEAFIYNVPTIYSKTNFSTRFIAPNWSVSYNSYNNYSIKIKLQEVSA
jgi:phage-related protein